MANNTRSRDLDCIDLFHTTKAHFSSSILSTDKPSAVDKTSPVRHGIRNIEWFSFKERLLSFARIAISNVPSMSFCKMRSAFPELRKNSTNGLAREYDVSCTAIESRSIGDSAAIRMCALFCLFSAWIRRRFSSMKLSIFAITK